MDKPEPNPEFRAMRQVPEAKSRVSEFGEFVTAAMTYWSMYHVAPVWAGVGLLRLDHSKVRYIYTVEYIY